MNTQILILAFAGSFLGGIIVALAIWKLGRPLDIHVHVEEKQLAELLLAELKPAIPEPQPAEDKSSLYRKAGSKFLTNAPDNGESKKK